LSSRDHECLVVGSTRPSDTRSHAAERGPRPYGRGPRRVFEGRPWCPGHSQSGPPTRTRRSTLTGTRQASAATRPGKTPHVDRPQRLRFVTAPTVVMNSNGTGCADSI